MRIAIGTTGLPPGAGIGTYVDQITKFFIERNHDVKIFYTSMKPIAIENYPYKIEPHLVPYKKSEELKVLQKLYSSLINFDPDVVINNDNIYISGILPSLPIDTVRISVVHGFRTRFGWDANKIINSAAIYNYEYIDSIITIFNAMKNNMIKAYPELSKFTYTIYNGLYPCYGNFTKNPKKTKEEHIKLMFAGGSKHLKGADTLLAAIEKLAPSVRDQITLYWAGRLKKKGIISAQRLSKYECIKPVGFVPRDKLIRIMSQCHYVLLPSRSECCPMLLLEAMSLGIVPIVSDCTSAMKEILSEGGFGFIHKTGNSRELKNIIAMLTHNGKEWADMATKAYDYFQQNLHIKIYGDKLLWFCRNKRKDRRMQVSPFPCYGLLPFHRRDYKGNKLNMMNLRQRWRFLTGSLPKPL